MLRAKWFPDQDKFTGRKLKKTTCEDIQNEEVPPKKDENIPEERHILTDPEPTSYEPVGISIAEPEAGEEDQEEAEGDGENVCCLLAVCPAHRDAGWVAVNRTFLVGR